MAERLSEAEILAQVDAATRRARRADATEPRAVAARYDPDSRLVTVELRNRCTFAFPPELEPDLAHLAPGVLAGVRVASGGRALHWEEPDVHIDVPGLIAHAIGLDAWAPKYLGSRTSAAKARASRENGRKGGRPRRRATPE
ncbi:MAG TPA: DUF2442 domain-containing protein [Longimicrobium sp.]|jgi:hypothetical protein